MQDFIAKRLAEMKNPEERALLRDVLSDVFLPMYEETEAKYAALEKRVRGELPLVYDAYKVYSTVVSRDRNDGGHSYLSPMIPDEATGHVIEAKNLLNSDLPVVETVFCEDDYLKCRQIVRDKVTLDGTIAIGAERYPFKCRLQPARRYLKEIEDLHGAFIGNALPWTTVNNAYLNKFFDVCITELLRKPPPESLILSDQIQIEFGPYKDVARRGMIPLWNIDKHQAKAEEFPLPVSSSVNYEYRFDLRPLGVDYGYLADSHGIPILNTRREGTDFIVVLPLKSEREWDLYRFRHRQDQVIGQHQYPIISNARKDSFSARLIGGYGAHIATLAEMHKLMNSFEVSEHLELTGFRFADRGTTGETYDMNPFFHDEVRDPAYKKTLVLSFSAKDRRYFLNRDIGSFLVTEMQSAYPEFHCVGTVS